MVRQDWLDAVGKEVPTIIDEFYDVLVAFTKNDPDGNGKDDTRRTWVPREFCNDDRVFVWHVWGALWCAVSRKWLNHISCIQIIWKDVSFIQIV